MSNGPGNGANKAKSLCCLSKGFWQNILLVVVVRIYEDLYLILECIIQ
jgi:hypothetical protein